MIYGKPVNGGPKFLVSSIRVRVTLTVTVRVSRVSVMVSVRDSVNNTILFNMVPEFGTAVYRSA